MRTRIVLFGLAAVVIAVLVALSMAGELLVDALWFNALGYRSVFATVLGARVGIFVIVWLAAFAAIFVSGLVALGLSGDRERLHIVRRVDGDGQISLPDLIRSLGDRVPWKLLVAAGGLVLGLFAAAGESSNWDTYLKAAYSVPFGSVDPAYGRDVGFYIFTMPLLEELRDLFLLILFLAAALSAAVYWGRGAVDLRQTPPRVESGAIAHLSLMAGLFFVIRAYSYWLDRFGLLLHTNGVVFGLRYVDSVFWRPGLWLLVILSILAAALCLANMRERGVRLLIISAVIVFAPAVAMNFLEPIVERLWVKPDELRVERPFLVRNIEMTRRAFKLDSVEVKPFSGTGPLTPASLSQDDATIKNIRLWDPRPLLATYSQLQEIRLYYDFKDIAVDRYRIDGRYTQVMLSARELDPARLPSRTWVNEHLKFTHGTGIAMNPVNAKDSEGLPIFYVKDIPPTSSVGLQITQPGIYFGEESDSDDYAVVKTNAPEFDYPRGNDNVFGYYQADSGIPISGLARRLLFGYFFRDVNLLVTDTIQPQSRIFIRRNIAERVARLAPFLTQDHDPYIVLSDGHLSWIIDCYTTSDHYPYSQRNPDQINYIRNSVKVVVDAYTGATTFYVADPDDPIIRCWMRIFPALFKPLSAMAPSLRAHIRYPEDFFMVQADIYRTYHMKDPQVFYNREDLWGFPRENYGGDTVTMQPYYVIMRLPGESDQEYILMLPMVPRGRDNMISWMAARCDGDHYGHLLEYAFSKEKLIYGPYQIQARINQSPDISRQLSLWNQLGSKVILGNLIVIPIQDSLLYVEPLYIRAENGQLPQLQRVIAAYSDRVVMGDDLAQTLKALFIGLPPSPPELTQGALPVPIAPPAASVTAAPVSMPADIKQASEHYDRAIAALKLGDWTAFGQEMQALGRELKRPADEGHH
ncbi:MAG: UPF0182 family protein [Candidatus Binataceae bacterium]